VSSYRSTSSWTGDHVASTDLIVAIPRPKRRPRAPSGCLLRLSWPGGLGRARMMSGTEGRLKPRRVSSSDGTFFKAACFDDRTRWPHRQIRQVGSPKAPHSVSRRGASHVKICRPHPGTGSGAGAPVGPAAGAHSPSSANPTSVCHQGKIKTAAARQRDGQRAHGRRRELGSDAAAGAEESTEGSICLEVF
jgi:hypothetical protein